MTMGSSNSKQPLNIASERQLINWLSDQSIDTSRWGQQRARSVADLWQEIRQGESYLYDAPSALRVIEIALIIIRRDKKILFEVEQQFKDGRIRQRNWPMSEKIKKGEDCFAAALRGIKEELGVEGENVCVDSESCRIIQFFRDSISYPGLRTLYKAYCVNAQIDGLPNDNFNTYESSDNMEDSVRKHSWSWQMPSGDLRTLSSQI
jgi:hypothetical protein